MMNKLLLLLLIFSSIGLFSNNFKIDKYLTKWLSKSDSVLMFNYETGEILYEYNPQMFVKKIPIGSVFKIVTSFLFLEKNIYNENYQHKCEKTSKSDDKLPCWNKEGHGLMNIETAFVNSCNKFYYSLAYSLKDIKTVLKKIGFNINIEELDFSKRDLLLMLAGNTPHIKADFYDLSRLISMIANNGVVVDIKSLKSVRYIPQSRIIKKIRSFMLKVVLSGTAKKAFFKAYGFSGKTGTAKDLNGLQNGLFIGYTKDKPYAIIVNLYNNLGSTSAMIASDVIYLYSLKL